MEHTLALIERSHQGDKEARDTIFKENAGLIYSVAEKISRKRRGHGRSFPDRKYWSAESSGPF